MKQVININFQGRIVPIEVTAYEILKQYIESLTRHFDAEEGKEEIINDIENRIGELFQERIKAGATCIVDDDVNAIIKSIGRPEDFDDAETSSTTDNQKSAENNKQQQSSFTTASGRKRLFRDENHKLVGGVCSGIANYFDIDIAIVRIIFAILFFTFGIGLIPYIILWIAVPSSATTVIGSRRKKLYRDTDDKYVGGVCSGIAHYFGISVWIPRALFLIPFLSFAGRIGHWDDFMGFDSHNIISFSPGALFVYIIFWLVLPEANSTAEKLEMKGEKVDMNSIKESVVEEMKGVQQRVNKFGKEAAGVAAEKGKAFGSEASTIARKSGSTFGNIIAFLVKAFVYFILGVVGFALVVGLFAIGTAAIGVFPAKDFLLTDGWQTALAWGTLLFFIIAPMIGIITWIIRRITKVKTGSKMLRLGFSAMWVVGWFCVIFLVASVSKDFKRLSNINEEPIALSNPKVNALEITTQGATSTYYNSTRWFRVEPFDNIDEDTAFIRNIQIHIVKSLNDSFSVSSMKLARGATRKYADTLASLIKFNVTQKDSMLIIDKGIAINKTDKFRNQKVIVTVYVPVGKRIKINGSAGRMTNISFDGLSVSDTDFENIDFNNVENDWNEGVWYVMTKDGLTTLDGKSSSSYKRNGVKINEDGIDIRDGKNRIRINENGITTEKNSDNDEENSNADEPGTYRYDDKGTPNKFDSLRNKIKQDEKKYNDSMEAVKKKISMEVDKYNTKETSLLYNVLPNNLLMMSLK
jgi:phage shock protein PspC (stress-responsive transcriptional regulator)